jgi:hypothetical protein
LRRPKSASVAAHWGVRNLSCDALVCGRSNNRFAGPSSSMISMVEGWRVSPGSRAGNHRAFLAPTRLRPCGPGAIPASLLPVRSRRCSRWRAGHPGSPRTLPVPVSLAGLLLAHRTSRSDLHLPVRLLDSFRRRITHPSKEHRDARDVLIASCRDLHKLADPAYLSGFLVSGLPRVASYCARGDVRMVSNGIALIGSAGTELRLRSGAFVRAGIQHRLACLAGLLGTVHRGVGAAQYLLWGFPIGGAQTYTDARRYHPLESSRVQGSSQTFPDPPGNPYRVACARDVFKKHGEFVPPKWAVIPRDLTAFSRLSAIASST